MSRAPEPAHDHAGILIVDDERSNRELLEIMLTPQGFKLTTACSGEDALAAVARDPPDLILLDVMMPGMDGYAVASRLKASPSTKHIPIIMITALDDRNARMLGLETGAEDFLSKPVDRAELSVRVRNLLRLKAYGDYLDRYGQMLEGEVGSRTAALVDSERLYRATFDAAPVGIVHVGRDGRWLRVNQRLCDLLGYSHQELSGGAPRAPPPQSEPVPGEAEALRSLADGTLARHVVDEKQFRHRDGRIVWGRVNISVHRDAEGQFQHFIEVVEDITERRALEGQLRQASKMDAIGGLAAGLAHDLNNVLSVVLSYSELLAADLKDGDPMLSDLDEINGAGYRAVALTRQLLAFSRQQVLQPCLVELAEVVVGMQSMLRRVLGEDIELAVIRAPEIRKALVDPGQMEQVIMNLVVNARDAMPQGGKLTIETSATYFEEAYTAAHVGMKPGSHVGLSVTDTGVGMDKATQARAFEPFFTTKAVGKGTGLGLATVFGIVRQSGGTIWVESEPGAGTTFEVYFPAAQGDDVPSVSVQSAEHPSLRGSETILLVEDDEHVRALAHTILRKYGYTVLEAQSGGDALLLCEQHPGAIHLLVTDVVMPRMSGRQLAERLTKSRPELKVLYMSGYSDEAVSRHGVVEASASFLQKPLTPEILAAKVRATLDSIGCA